MLETTGESENKERRVTGPESRVFVYDVGGSHISAAVFDRETCDLHGRASAGYPAEQTTDTFLNVLYSLATLGAQGQTGILGASLAMPGPFDYAAGVSWARHKLQYLYGFDLRGALSTHFGWPASNVRFLNDAAAYLMGEISAGAGRGVGRVVGITLGTGVGSGFAVDGQVVREGAGVPAGGEIWNFPYLGGIVEDQISTRAIQQIYRKRTGQEREVAAIAASAANDPVAAETFTEFGRNLGVALRAVLSTFAPRVIVLGGGIARSANLFLAAAQDEVGDLAELRVSALGDHAPLVGAGAAWFQKSNAVPATAQTAATNAGPGQK